MTTNLSNSHDNWEGLPPVSKFSESLPSYSDGDATVLHTDSHGRLIVTLDDVPGNTFRQEELQLARLKHENKMEIRRLDYNKEIIGIERAADVKIAFQRYEFLATLVRWSISGISALAAVYFLA